MKRISLPDSPLHQAVLSDDVRAIKRICGIKDINSINPEGYSALHLAIIKKKDQALDTLIKCDADTNQECKPTNFNPLTALQLAVSRKNYHALERLLQEPKTDPLKRSYSGNTAFELAIIYADKVALKIIYKYAPQSMEERNPRWGSMKSMASMYFPFPLEKVLKEE